MTILNIKGYEVMIDDVFAPIILARRWHIADRKRGVYFSTTVKFPDGKRREGDELRELPARDGYIVQDDNLLSCSEGHIREVFAMLARQKKRAVFSGGLEARKLKKWHIEELLKLKPKQLFFAYDTPDDRDPLFAAGELLFDGGFSRRSQNLRAYVLIGYPGDTFEKAEKRLTETMQAGFLPFAMLYRDQTGNRDPAWIKFSWPWSRPAAISAKYKEIGR